MKGESNFYQNMPTTGMSPREETSKKSGLQAPIQTCACVRTYCRSEKLKRLVSSGGGNVPNEGGALFGPALRWMTYEAAYFGLRMRHHKGDWGRIPLKHSMGWPWRVVEYIPFLVPRTAFHCQNKIRK